MNKIIAKISNVVITPQRFPLLLAAVSLSALSFAWVSQYVFNFQPCPLCLYQRKPYLVAVGLGLLSTLLYKRAPRVSFAMLCGIAVCFAAGIGLSGFHTGVEQGWWKGLEACGDATLPEGASLDEMRKYLMNRPVIDCRIPGWTFMGISMTAYNFMLSCGLFAFSLFGIGRVYYASRSSESQ